MKTFLAALLTFFLTSPVHALSSEQIHAQLWCERHNGELNVTLEDGTRVDCLTERYAAEVEYLDNWAEAPGQALHYAQLTDRQPAIVFIVDNRARDWRYVPRAMHATPSHIRVWLSFTVP